MKTTPAYLPPPSLRPTFLHSSLHSSFTSPPLPIIKPATTSPTMLFRPESSQPSPSSSQSPPPPLSFFDFFRLSLSNMLNLYFPLKSHDRTPLAQGDVSEMLGDSPFFKALHRYYENTGPIYKLAFGPKVFIVVQDPVVIRHILRENSHLYDKGILAEILEDIMGKGLIPADYETWKIRRRAIVPGFHKAWLMAMTGMFAECTQVLCDKLEKMAETKEIVDMEAQYCSLTLDIIGKAVFNYEFQSVNQESPVIQAVYRVLRESEHRSMTFLPYWKLPGITLISQRQREFRRDMKLINDTLNVLIRTAKKTRTDTDVDELKQRDYSKITQDRSLLRFLVDLRGEETTNKQLRDDLITMLIAGHETTGAALTWATFELAKRPDLVRRAQEEVDDVIGDRYPNFDDVKKLSFIRRILAESLRLYPEPPLLIRRLLADDVLPKGGAETRTELRRGTDIFINVYSLHRSKDLWERPNEFDPDRWLRSFTNPGLKDWRGYIPALGLEEGSPLYPNEQNADFAYLPFGGGTRKCIGDQFAVLESVIALAMIVRRFDLELVDNPADIEMDTGATIHCRNGLQMRLRPRLRNRKQVSQSLEDQFAAPSATTEVVNGNGNGSGNGNGAGNGVVAPSSQNGHVSSSVVTAESLEN